MWTRARKASEGMKMRNILFVSLLLLTLVWNYGCGAASVVTVTISPLASTALLGQQIQFTVVVTGSYNTTVLWAVNNVTNGNSSLGTITAQGLYTAPVSPINAATVNITATSVADTAYSATATVTITSGAVITVLPTLGATIEAGPNQCYQFTDIVTNSVDNTQQNTAVYWYVNTVQGGNQTTGSITLNGYYCAPNTISSPTTFTIKAVLQANSESYGTTLVTVIPPGAAAITTPYPPLSLAQGSPFENVFVQGSNFLSTSIVLVNFEPVPTTFINTNVLLAQIPGSLLIPATPGQSGQIGIEVEQLDGTYSSLVALNTFPAAPALISTTPDSFTHAVSTSSSAPINIGMDGGYFLPSTSVEFNGHPASTQFQSNSNTQLNVTANASQIGVTTGGLYPLNVRNMGLPNQIAAWNFAVQPPVSGQLGPQILTTYAVGAKPSSVVVNSATGVALVANRGGNTISAFNMAAFASSPQGNPQLPTTTVGRSPTSIAIDEINNLAFVVNSGDASISILDLSPLSASSPGPANVLTTIINTTATPLDLFPYSITVNSLTKQALVIYQNDTATTFINYGYPVTASNIKVTTDVVKSQIQATGVTPQIAIEPNLDWALVTPGGSGSGTSSGSATVAFIDLNQNGNQVVAGIAPPSSNGAVRYAGTSTITTLGPHGLAVNQTVVIAGVSDPSFDGTYVVATVPSSTSFTYTQSGLANTTITGTGNGTVSAPAPLVTVNVQGNSTGIAINQETEQAVLTNPQSTTMTILNLLDQTTTSITNGIVGGYSGVAVNPLTNMAVAANYNNNQVALIDLGNPQNPPLALINVGNYPTAVAIDAASNIALVVNQNDGTVTFLQLGQIRSTLPTAQPQIVDLSLYNTLTSSSAQTISVMGGGFTGNSVVRLSEIPLTTTYVSSRELTATIPSTMLASPIRYVVDVQNADGTVSNVKDFTVMQAITVGTSPLGVAIDPIRDYAVVANTGSNSVTVINLANMSIKANIPLVGLQPMAVAVAPLYGRAAVTDNMSDDVSVIDLDQLALAATVAIVPGLLSTTTTTRPVGIAIHPGTGEVVVACSNASQVSTFNIQSPGTPASLAIGVGPFAVAIDPFQNIAAVTETGGGASGSNQLAIVNLAGGAGSGTGTVVSLQILDQLFGFQLPTTAIYDPVAGNFIIGSSMGNDIVTVTANVYNSTYETNNPPYPVGINPTSMDYNYRSSTLVTANTMSQTLTVMDYLSKKVVAVIPVSVSQQFGVAIDPNTNRAVVVDQNNNRVLIIPLPR